MSAWDASFRLILHHPWLGVTASAAYLFPLVALGALFGLLTGLLYTLILRRMPAFNRAGTSNFFRKFSAWSPAFFLLPLAVVLSVQYVREHRQTQFGGGSIRRIVLISVDTLRADYVGAYGARLANTPRMDQVAKEGALFVNAISPIPLTGPSHISMFTGLSPLRHGALRNGYRSVIPPITERIRGAGFQTAAFVAGYPLKSYNSGLERGFQVYDDRISPVDSVRDSALGNVIAGLPFVDQGLMRPGKEVTQRALGWLNTHADNPFFLFIHYYDCHYPYDKTEEPENIEEWGITSTPAELAIQKALYKENVETVDSYIGDVIDLLKERKIYDSTLLIITADHGESLGEHNYYYDHSMYLYDQMLRVPMIIRYPQRVPAGSVIDSQIGIVDIYPTLFAAAGLSAGKNNGNNLLQVVRNSQGLQPEIYLASHTYGEEDGTKHSVRTERWKLILNEENHARPWELYNLKSDPGERKNLAGMMPDIAQRLRHFLSSELHRKEGFNAAGELTDEQIEALESLGY